MEEKKMREDSTDAPCGDERWTGVFWLSFFLLLEASALSSMTIWQQRSLAYYTEKIDSGSQLLAELEQICIPQLEDSEDLVMKNARFEQPQDPLESRNKRQTLSGLFHDLVLAQEHVLAEVCRRRTDLCVLGAKGAHGEPGDAGLMGTAGSKGDVGVAGPMGEKGQPGPSGSSGSAGPLGPKGTKGDTGVSGTAGLKGEPGDKGSTGDAGPAGSAGANGTRGERGAKGPTGPPGPTGEQGEPGPKGAMGEAGPQGPAGDAGTAGQVATSADDDCLCFQLPTITGNFSDTVSVREYHKLVLHCDVSDPNAKITWRRADGQRIPRNVNVTGNDIIFLSVSPVDTGMYQCVTNSSAGEVTKSVEIKMIEPSKGDCDFEQGGFCLWTNTQDDKFDWILNQGSTPTAHTGPTTDHTRGDSVGYYAYIETSDPRLRRDNARLESQALSPSKSYCLSFWYHLYGHSIGDINVRIKQNGLVGSPVWNMIGPSEDVWHQAKISVPAQATPFSLIIEGVRGDSYNGDAAIDDLTLAERSCRP